MKLITHQEIRCVQYLANVPVTVCEDEPDVASKLVGVCVHPSVHPPLDRA